MCVPLCRRSYETDGGDIYQIKPILRAGLTSGGGKGAWVERVCVPSVRSLYHPHTRSSVIRVLDRTGTARLRLAAAPRTSQHRESQHVPF